MKMEDVWKQRLKIRRDGQYDQYLRFQLRNKQIGIPAIITSTIVGSAIFGTIGEEGAVELLIPVAGALSIVAAALSALQTFLAYDKLSEKSKQSADQYSALLMKLEDFLDEHNELTLEFKRDIRTELEIINREAPPLHRDALERLSVLDDNSPDVSAGQRLHVVDAAHKTAADAQ